MTNDLLIRISKHQLMCATRTRPRLEFIVSSDPLCDVLLLLRHSIVVHVYLSFIITFVYMLTFNASERYAKYKDTVVNILCSSSLCLLFISQHAIIPHEVEESEDIEARKLEAEMLGLSCTVSCQCTFAVLGLH